MHRFLVGKPLGRPRAWEENIMVHVKKTGCKDGWCMEQCPMADAGGIVSFEPLSSTT
jgi:hypothetical protein